MTAVAATGPSGSSRGSLEINNGPLAEVVALGNASDPFMPLFLEKVYLSGKAAGVEIAPVTVLNADELEAAFATILKDGAGALVMQGSCRAVPLPSLP